MADITSGCVTDEQRILLREQLTPIFQKIESSIALAKPVFNQIQAELQVVVPRILESLNEQCRQKEQGKELARIFEGLTFLQLDHWMEQNPFTPMMLVGLIYEITGMKTEKIEAMREAVESQLNDIHTSLAAGVVAMNTANAKNWYTPAEKCEWAEIGRQLFSDEPNKYKKKTGAINQSSLARDIAAKCSAAKNTIYDHLRKTGFYGTLAP